MSEEDGDQGLLNPDKVLDPLHGIPQGSPPLFTLFLLAGLGTEINTDFRDLVVLWMIHFPSFLLRILSLKRASAILESFLKVVKMDGVGMARLWWVYLKAVRTYSNLNLVVCQFLEFCALGG